MEADTQEFTIFNGTWFETVVVTQREIDFIMDTDVKHLDVVQKEIHTKMFMKKLEKEWIEREKCLEKTDACIKRIEAQLADDSLERKFKEFQDSFGRAMNALADWIGAALTGT